jgi:hypothetical protein
MYLSVHRCLVGTDGTDGIWAIRGDSTILTTDGTDGIDGTNGMRGMHGHLTIRGVGILSDGTHGIIVHLYTDGVTIFTTPMYTTITAM